MLTLQLNNHVDPTYIPTTPPPTATMSIPEQAQIGAQKSGPEIIMGVTIVVVLLIVTGLVVAIIIVATIFKKRGKGFGGYSLPGKEPKSNGTEGIVLNNGAGKSLKTISNSPLSVFIIVLQLIFFR